MIKKIILLITLANSPICAVDSDTNATLTRMLHYEAFTHTNRNIDKETHPVLYDMIQRLSQKAGVSMPRYITLHRAEGIRINPHTGKVEYTERDVNARANIYGDLHICYEILTNLSYEEIEGVLAVAIAAKAYSKPAKLMATGYTSFMAMLGLIYRTGKSVFGSYSNSFRDGDKEFFKTIGFMCGSLIVFFGVPNVTTKIASNYMQKTIDLKAAQLTSPESIIVGIKGLIRLKDNYFKESSWRRITTAPYLGALFYPVRAFTDEERIQYLEDEARRDSYQLPVPTLAKAS